MTDFRGNIEAIGARTRCTHPGGHAPLRGLDEHGEFRTRAAAAYPAELNTWLAELIVTAACARRSGRTVAILCSQPAMRKRGRWCNQLVPANAQVVRSSPAGLPHTFSAGTASRFPPSDLPRELVQQQVEFVAPLRGREAKTSRADEDKKFIGGLRR